MLTRSPELYEQSKSDIAWNAFLDHIGVPFECIKDAMPEELEQILKESKLSSRQMALVRSKFNRLSHASIRLTRTLSDPGTGYDAPMRTRKEKYNIVLQILYEISKEKIDFESGIHTLVINTSDVVESEKALLLMFKKPGDDYFDYSVDANGITHGIHQPIGKGVLSLVAEKGIPINIIDASKDKRWIPEVDNPSGQHIKEVYCLPLHDFEGNVTGVLQLTNSKKHLPFDKTDEILATSLLHQAGLIVHRTQLFQGQRRARLRTEALLAVMTASREESSLWSFIKRVEKALYDALECDGIALYVVDKVHNELVISLSRLATGYRLQMGQGIAGHVALTGKKVNTKDAYDLPFFHHGVDKKKGYRTKQVLCVPVKGYDDKTVAVVQAINKKCNVCKRLLCPDHSTTFDQDDEEILEATSREIEVKVSTLSLSTAFESVLRDPTLAEETRQYMNNLYDSYVDQVTVGGDSAMHRAPII